jgi:hypothetical protein
VWEYTVECQTRLFDWIAAQHGLMGATFLVLGLLYGLCGYRFIRFLVLVPCTGLGCLVGFVLADVAKLPPGVTVPVMGVLGGILAIGHRWGAILLTSTATLGALGAYLTTQAGACLTVVLIGVGICATLGLVLTLLSRQSMIMLHTTLLGAALCVVGFVGLAAATMPEVAGSFRRLAYNYWLVVPLMLLMACVTLYSYQANLRQGDILTGSRVHPQL